MSKQLLFYDRVAPVSSERHGDWAIADRTDYAFARGVNSVPLVAIEFALALRDYPIVFAGDGQGVMPIVVLGAKPDRNEFVGDDGRWNASYVPGFVRRYPFVISRGEDGETFTLCIDESWEGCSASGDGQRLFDAAGKQTPYLERVLGFVRDYQAQFERTRLYCRRLVELDLLEPMRAEFKFGGEQQRSLTGFSAVNRDRLKALAPEKLAELAASDELELTYMHLASMQNLQGLVARSRPDAEASVTGDAGSAALGESTTAETAPE